MASRRGALLFPSLSSKGGEGDQVVGWWQCQTPWSNRATLEVLLQQGNRNMVIICQAEDVTVILGPPTGYQKRQIDRRHFCSSSCALGWMDLYAGDFRRDSGGNT